MNEIEVCVFAEVSDWDGLAQASKKIRINEYSLYREETKSRIRIRAIKEDNEPGSIEFTVKTKVMAADNPDVLQAVENTVPVTPEFTKAFIAAMGGVEMSMCDRYFFPTKSVKLEIGDTVIELPELVFELDVFYVASGQGLYFGGDPAGQGRYPLVKVELELQDAMPKITAAVENYEQTTGKKVDDDAQKIRVNLSNLPFKPINFIPASTKDAEQRAKIDALYAAVKTKIAVKSKIEQ